MEKRKIKERLLLGLLVAAACAAPLACSDDEGGKTNGNDAGASGSGETAGNAGSVAHGGAGGTTAMGGADMGGADMGGADMGGADMGGADMGGANAGGGAGSPGAAGEAGMAGAGTAPDEAAQYQTHIDAICTVQASLDCSQSHMPASNKQSCLNSFSDLTNAGADCGPEIRAWAACLAPQPAASYECAGSDAFPKDGVCADTQAAVGTCFSP